MACSRRRVMTGRPMKTENTIQPTTERPSPPEDRAGERRRVTTTAKVVILAVLALIVGFVGRSLVSDGVSNSFLADLLPWLKGTPVTVYFADVDGTRLVPVSLTLTGDEDSPEGLMAALLDGPPEGTDLVQLMPPGTSVSSIALDGDTLVLDLSSDFGSGHSELADEAVIQTLGSWPEAAAVQVTVDGAPLEQTSGTGHLLFFYDPTRDLLVAEPATATTVRDVLDEYLAGPQGTDLIGLPDDVQVLELHSAPGSGLLQLNMTYTPSVREMALEDSDAMRRILEGLMATLTTGFSDSQFLYLDFEGRAKLGLGQCADLLRRVQPPPRVLNDQRLLEMEQGL